MDTEQLKAAHALVCNGFGYDKSFVRALAIWARQHGDDYALWLAGCVLQREEEARRLIPCSEVHPYPSPSVTETEETDQ